MLRAEIGEIEQPADLPARRFGDDQRVRHGQALQPGGEVRGLADHPALLRRPSADQIADHGEPAGDAQPHAQIFSRRQSADRLDYREAGAHRPLGIVLMRLRIAEINEHAVAHVFGDKAGEPPDRFGDATVIGADDLAQVLGIKARRQRRRTDQIAKHHRQLPALGLGGSRRTRAGRRRHGGRNRHAEGGNRVQQLAPVADRGHADADQVFDR